MIDAPQCARPAAIHASSRGRRRSDPYGDTRALRAARAQRASEARRGWERMLLDMASTSGRERMSERWREMQESLRPLEDELVRLQLLPPRELPADEPGKPAEQPQDAPRPPSLAPAEAFAALEFGAALYRIAGEQADGVLALRAVLQRQRQQQLLALLQAAAAASRGAYTSPSASSAAISLLA
jgi:hypothetical protein